MTKPTKPTKTTTTTATATTGTMLMAMAVRIIVLGESQEKLSFVECVPGV